MSQSTGATSCLACQKPLREKNNLRKRHGFQSLSVLLTAFDEEMSVLSIRAQNSKNEKHHNFVLDKNNFDRLDTLGESDVNNVDINTRNAAMKYTKNNYNNPSKSVNPSNMVMLSMLSHNNSFNNIIDNDNYNSNNNNVNNSNNNIVKNSINNINNITNNNIKNIPNNKNQNGFGSPDFNLTNNRPFPTLTSPIISNLLPNGMSSVPKISSNVPNNTNVVPNGTSSVPNFAKLISKK